LFGSMHLKTLLKTNNCKIGVMSW